MAKTDYKKTMSELGAKLLTEKPQTPIQEVRPVETAGAAPKQVNKAKQEAHVNFWVSDELMERLKIRAAKSRKTIKQIGIEAFEQYLDSQE